LDPLALFLLDFLDEEDPEDLMDALVPDRPVFDVDDFIDAFVPDRPVLDPIDALELDRPVFEPIDADDLLFFFFFSSDNPDSVFPSLCEGGTSPVSVLDVPVPSGAMTISGSGEVGASFGSAILKAERAETGAAWPPVTAVDICLASSRRRLAGRPPSQSSGLSPPTTGVSKMWNNPLLDESALLRYRPDKPS